MFLGEPGRARIDAIFRGGVAPAISVLNLAEVVDTLVRVRGHEPEVIRDKTDLLMVAGLEVEPVWLHVMWLATSLRAKHYHRKSAAVSLADCVCIATAMMLETDLATTDPALAAVARAAGVEVVALPDSEGRVP